MAVAAEIFGARVAVVACDGFVDLALHGFAVRLAGRRQHTVVQQPLPTGTPGVFEVGDAAGFGIGVGIVGCAEGV